MAGKFFNEWQIGDTIAHEIRRTVTETDNLLFSVMTHNPQPHECPPRGSRWLTSSFTEDR